MVTFKQDKAVEIIQKSWIRLGKTLRAVWPTNWGGRNINEIVMDDESIEDTSYIWKTYGIDVMYECGKLLILYYLFLFASV